MHVLIKHAVKNISLLASRLNASTVRLFSSVFFFNVVSMFFYTKKRLVVLLCGSRKYPYPPPRKGLEFPGGWGGQGPRKILRGEGCCINLYYLFQTGSIIPIC